MSSNASLDPVEQQYLHQLHQEYKEDLQQIRRNANMRFWYQFIRFWAAFLFVAEIIYVGWVAFTGGYSSHSVFSLDTAALILLAAAFATVYFVCDHYIA